MEEEKDKIINVPVEDILPNRFQPRLAFDEKELQELANSIVRYGVIQPIVLRKMGDKYEIIAGERRYKATILAGLKTVPAIINNTDDDTSAEIALLENLQRKNLTVIEEAQSFKKLLDRNFTQEEIATKLGISQSSIANKLRLLNLPKKVQESLLYNKISERHARSLLSLDDEDQQKALLDRIIKEKLTVRQTEDEINKILNKKIDDNDIPNEIKKFITNDDSEESKEENQEEQKEIHFVNEVPEVVNISEKNNSEEEVINPFQAKFEDNIRKIQSEIFNKDEKYYDDVINNSNINNLVSNKEDFILEEITSDNNKEDLPKMISRIRGFINDMNKNGNISVSEVDLDNKYQILIEIKKGDN